MNIGEPVDMLTNFVKFFSLFLRPTQRPIVFGSLDPRPTHFERRIQPNCYTAVLIDEVAIPCGDPGAAAKRDHTGRTTLEQFAQHVCLYRAKSRLTFLDDDLGRSSSLL